MNKPHENKLFFVNIVLDSKRLSDLLEVIQLIDGLARIFILSDIKDLSS